MKNYTFYVIHTVVDVGDGSNTIKDNNITTSLNLGTLISTVINYGYPMMVSVNVDEIDLSDASNAEFYQLPQKFGNCLVTTLKFALSEDIDIDINNIPLVIPTVVNEHYINRFRTSGDLNTSIIKKTFS